MDPLNDFEVLKEALDYNPETGLFVWKFRARSPKKWNTRHHGKIAGSLHKSLGYNMICLNGKTQYAHRLAWLYVYGVTPEGQIDHQNGCRSDNRIENLRDVTLPENRKNVRRKSASGLPQGVSLRKGRYQARISRGKGCTLSLGCFDTPEEAHLVYLGAARTLGYHANHGVAQ